MILGSFNNQHLKTFHPFQLTHTLCTKILKKHMGYRLKRSVVRLEMMILTSWKLLVKDFKMEERVGAEVRAKGETRERV